VELDGAIDPLSITARSVIVTRDDGRPLTAHLSSGGRRLFVDVEVGPELLDDRPGAIVLRIVGLPSVHALGTRDGRRLGRSETLVHPVERDLDRLGTVTARLTRVAGRDLPPPQPLEVGRVLSLEFDGVLDPKTLLPGSCSLWPRQAGLVLSTPVRPEVDWRCVGSRFELHLGLGETRGSLELDMRRLGILDLSGARPEPPLVVEVVAS
jgi:hypothetical protein